MEPIGNIPPAEAEERYYTIWNKLWRRDSKTNGLRQTRGGSVEVALGPGSGVQMMAYLPSTRPTASFAWG
jgi:hypothetical protein